MATKKDSRLTGINPLSYMGVEPESPSLFISVDRTPTAKDYKGYNIGTRWLDRSATEVWILVSKDAGVSTWLNMRIEGGADTLTGDTGGVITSDTLNNIDVLGGTNISTAGTANTLTINLDANTVAEQFDTDLGIAFPLVGIINILGGTNISTSGLINSVTIDVDPNTIADTYTTDSGNAIPAGGVINIVGAGTISTAGAGSTVTISVAGGPTYPPDEANFKAYISGDVANVTGDSTEYTIIFNTELWDVGSDFDTTTGVFTAPSNGIYFFIGVFDCNDPAAATRDLTDTWIRISGTYAQTNAQNNMSPEFLVDGDTAEYSLSYHTISRMETGDTAHVSFRVGPGAKTVTLKQYGATDNRTWFSGYKLSDGP